MQEYNNIIFFSTFINIMKFVPTSSFKKVTFKRIEFLYAGRKFQGLIDNIILDSPLPIPSRTAGSFSLEGELSQA